MVTPNNYMFQPLTGHHQVVHICTQRDKLQQHSDLGYYYHIQEIIPPTSAHLTVLQKEPRTIAILRATPHHSRQMPNRT